MASRIEVLGICVERGGYRRGALVAQFIAEWEVCVRRHKCPVGIEEFAQWWRDSPRTAYRRLAEFRGMFPELGEHATPGDLMAPLLERLRYDEPPYGVDLADVPLDLGALA